MLRQIGNLQALLAENDEYTRICKKVRPYSRDSNATAVAHSFQPSPSSPQSVINTQDSSSQSALEMETSQIKILRPPPIFVYGVTNYTEFIKFLKSQDVDNCLHKETKSALILTTTSADQYRKLHKVLRQECAVPTGKDSFGQLQLHSYQLKEDRAFVVFLRGLPSTMKTDEIKEALLELKYNPRNVYNVPKKIDGILQPRPLFRIELEPAETNSSIYDLTNLLHVRIKVEPPKPRRDPSHCSNCQRLGHTKHYCLRLPRCIKCGAEYKSNQCPLPSTEKCKCANCSGNHPANYRGCKAFQQLRKKQHRATDEIRRRGDPSTQTNLQQIQNVQPSMSLNPSSQPNSHQPARTFASVASRPSTQHSDSLAHIVTILTTLSTQLASLDQRLSALERFTPTDAGWTPAQSRNSHRHHE